MQREQRIVPKRHDEVIFTEETVAQRNGPSCAQRALTFLYYLLPPSSSHPQAIFLNPLLRDWIVPLELPPVHYDCFSLTFLTIALSNPFALSLRNSDSFSGDFVHLSLEFPIGPCCGFLPPPLLSYPAVYCLWATLPPYSIHFELC